MTLQEIITKAYQNLPSDTTVTRDEITQVLRLGARRAYDLVGSYEDLLDEVQAQVPLVSRNDVDGILSWCVADTVAWLDVFGNAVESA